MQYNDRYGLFLPTKSPDEAGDNLRRIEDWANKSGLTSYLTPLAGVLSGWQNPTDPAPTKYFIQGEGFEAVTIAGGAGKATLTFPMPFPNGCLTCIVQYAVTVAAGAFVVVNVIAATNTTATLEFHVQAGAGTAYLGDSAQRVSYIAIGF